MIQEEIKKDKYLKSCGFLKKEVKLVVIFTWWTINGEKNIKKMYIEKMTFNVLHFWVGSFDLGH